MLLKTSNGCISAQLHHAAFFVGPCPRRLVVTAFMRSGNGRVPTISAGRPDESGHYKPLQTPSIEPCMANERRASNGSPAHKGPVHVGRSLAMQRPISRPCPGSLQDTEDFALSVRRHEEGTLSFACSRAYADPTHPKIPIPSGSRHAAQFHFLPSIPAIFATPAL